MQERFDYFKNIENKYKSKISLKNPVIIRLDGRHICSNKNIDLLNEDKGGFSYALKGTAEYFSDKYGCAIYCSSDELNFIIEEPKILEQEFESVDTQRISSLISQEIFEYFNGLYKNKPSVYFDARCFVIPKNKVKSYLLYRRNCEKNVLTIYFSKDRISHGERAYVELSKLDKMLSEKFKEYNERDTFQTEGLIYYYGIPYSYEDYVSKFL